MKRILLLLMAFGITSCDTEGEIIQGRTVSSIAPNSGAAGGHTPVVSGVYYDSIQGLTISAPGLEGDVLVLDEDLKPRWVAPDVAFPTLLSTRLSLQSPSGAHSKLSGSNAPSVATLKALQDLSARNHKLEQKIQELEARFERLTQN